MTDIPGASERRPPARRNGDKVNDFTILVQVPRKPVSHQGFHHRPGRRRRPIRR
ncbi:MULTISPECIES: hypothetical protein [unclassified Mycolicibacterium]|uniref:hypothetical protein n=1 Tax=unclassified Mycolicibacterium TaxID=2636767 RepID=UPI0012DE8D7D|nr:MULTISPECIES: hypothetical protein [unclassified Mycolicibacterium]